jgi:dihydrofolate reductase/thymidylate synthase
MPFTIIAGAHITNRAIGAMGKIPWKCRADMNFFKETTSLTKDPTKMNAVIMGRKTFESLPAPLPKRLNVVLTSDTLQIPSLKNEPIGVILSNNFDKILLNLEHDPNIETIFVIGGEMVYRQTINHPKCEKIYLNLVHVVCDLSKSDAFFPNPDPTMYELVESAEIDVTVTKNIYNRIYQ